MCPRRQRPHGLDTPLTHTTRAVFTHLANQPAQRRLRPSTQAPWSDLERQVFLASSHPHILAPQDLQWSHLRLTQRPACLRLGVRTAVPGLTLAPLMVVVGPASEPRAALPLAAVVPVHRLVVVAAAIMVDTMVEAFPPDRLVVVTHQDRLARLVAVHRDHQVLDLPVPLVAAAAAAVEVLHFTHHLIHRTSLSYLP